MSKQAWPVSIRDLKKNTVEQFKQVTQQKAYIFYPVFLLYAVTIIGLAKAVQVIFY